MDKPPSPTVPPPQWKKYQKTEKTEQRKRKNPDKGSLYLTIDTPDYEFDYRETNSHENEISDFYNYTDREEFEINYGVFKKELDNCGVSTWKSAGEAAKSLVFNNFMDKLEHKNVEIRIEASRGLLYLLQGCWKEAATVADQQQMARVNAMTFYQIGGFRAMDVVLNAKIDQVTKGEKSDDFKECQHFSVIIAIFYSLTEIVRNEMDDVENSPYKRDVINFRRELSTPSPENTFFIPKCFNLVDFAVRKAPYVSIKKTLLLVWKLLIVALGNWEERKILKDENRTRFLRTLNEDTIEVTKTMHKKNLELYKERVKPNQKFVWGSIPPPSNLWKLKVYEEEVADYEVYLKKRGSGNVKELQEKMWIVKSFLTMTYMENIRENCQDSFFFYQFLNDMRQGEPTHILYHGLIKNLPGHLTSFVKILIAATPPKAPGSAPDLRDVTNNEELANSELRRTQEIVTKSISGILLIMLKFFTVNHVYQFETVTEYLYRRKFIEVVLRHFRLNPKYVKEFNEDCSKIFPNCVLERTEVSPKPPVSPRNMLTFINLLRVLNKVVKHKPMRILRVLMLKGSRSLKPLLHVAHATPRIYVLKLYKLIADYYPRKWQLHNAHILTAVERCLRKRITAPSQKVMNESVINRYRYYEKVLNAEIAEYNRDLL